MRKEERLFSLILLQDLHCSLQQSISVSWVSSKSMAFIAVGQQLVFALSFFPRNDSQLSTSRLFFFFISSSNCPQNNILLFSYSLQIMEKWLISFGKITKEWEYIAELTSVTLLENQNKELLGIRPCKSKLNCSLATNYKICKPFTEQAR